MVGRVGHSGSKTEIIGLVDWLEKLRMLNNGSEIQYKTQQIYNTLNRHCLLYTSPSPRDRTRSRMPSSA